MQGGGGRRKGKRQPETQSDTPGHGCWVEKPRQVTRGWGQGLAPGPDPKDVRQRSQTGIPRNSQWGWGPGRGDWTLGQCWPAAHRGVVTDRSAVAVSWGAEQTSTRDGGLAASLQRLRDLRQLLLGPGPCLALSNAHPSGS